MDRERVGGSCTKATCGARRSAPVGMRPIGRPVDLPLVIRPAPVRLADVEHRARHDEDFARLLRDEPAVRATVARAILARDEDARARFEDAHTLAAHLSRVRA